MKITKQMDMLLKRRTQLAIKLNDVCYKVDKYLLKNDIDLDSACWLNGVEIYVNPEAAEKEVRKAIENKE